MAEKNEESRNKVKLARLRLEESIIESKNLLFESKYQKAYDTTYNSMIAEKEALGGEDSVHLLPGYFILVEALMAENKLKKAEEFLTGAYWNFLKTQDGEDKPDKDQVRADAKDLEDYHIELDKTFAKLFFKKHSYQEAAKKMRSAILMDSKRYGPEHPRTGLDYYLLGNIHEAMAETDPSLLTRVDAFYSRFIHIWYKFLHGELKRPTGALDDPKSKILCTEGLINFKRVEHIWAERFAEEDRSQALATPLIECNYALALLSHQFRQFQERTQYLETTLNHCERFLGKDHHKTQKLEAELRMLLEEEQEQEAEDDGAQDDGEVGGEDDEEELIEQND